MPAIRSYPSNRAVPVMNRRLEKAKDRSMTFMMLALLVAFALATTIVLADSGLRLWSAVAAIKGQRMAILYEAGLPEVRNIAAARVSTRVSYARQSPALSAPLRAAA